MKKHPEVTEKTRENLIRAFWQLYSQKSVENIHINEITDLAGYHRSTFYEYFNDIYELLSQEEQSLIYQVRQSVRILEESEQNMFTGIINFYQLNAEHVSLLIENGNMDFINQVKESVFPVFLSENNLTDSIQNAIYFEFVFNGMLMSLDYWYKHRQNVSLQELLSSLQNILQNGIIRPLSRGTENPEIPGTTA